MPSTIVAAKNVSFGRRPAMSETTKQSEDIANLAPMIREDFIDIEVLRARLRVTRERRAGLIEIYREHVTSHGC